MSNKLDLQSDLPHVEFLHAVYNDDLRFRVTQNKLKLLKKFGSVYKVNKLAGKLNKQSSAHTNDSIFNLSKTSIYSENLSQSSNAITIADIIKNINAEFTTALQPSGEKSKSIMRTLSRKSISRTSISVIKSKKSNRNNKSIRANTVNTSESSNKGERAEGGHIGAFKKYGDIRYKKYNIDFDVDTNEKQTKFVLTSDKIDRELLLYELVLDIYLRFCDMNDTERTDYMNRFEHLIHLYNYTSLPLLKNPATIKKIINVSDNFKGYEVGDICKCDESSTSCEPACIIDFKLGMFTKHNNDATYNDDITSETQAGGAININKVSAQLLLDSVTTSYQHGFRCEGVSGNLASDIKELYLVKSTKFNNSDYTEKITQADTSKILLLKKSDIISNMNKIIKMIQSAFSDSNRDETFNKLLGHYTHFDIFTLNNQLIEDYVTNKPEKTLNRALYSLPLLLTIWQLCIKFKDNESKSNLLNIYWDNVQKLTFEIFYKQYTELISDSGPEKNNNKYYIACIGSSIMINVNDGKVYLSDYGHPYVFTKKEYNENSALREIVKNFVYGGLSFYFMNYMIITALTNIHTRKSKSLFGGASSQKRNPSSNFGFGDVLYDYNETITYVDIHHVLYELIKELYFPLYDDPDSLNKQFNIIKSILKERKHGIYIPSTSEYKKLKHAHMRYKKDTTIYKYMQYIYTKEKVNKSKDDNANLPNKKELHFDLPIIKQDTHL